MRKPRRANLKPPGRCIFCGVTGVTREHMWADWLRCYIPRRMREHSVAATIVSPWGHEERVSRRTGDPHSRRIKCVCGECNNVWMSQLQEATKPFLIQTLKGEPTSL